MHDVKGYDIRLCFKEAAGGHSMRNVKGDDRVSFRKEGEGHSMYCVKGLNIILVQDMVVLVA